MKVNLSHALVPFFFRSQAGGQASGTTFSHAYESELERFRQRLRESRERIRREVAVVRDSRSRNRLSHQNTPCSEGQRIVSDGLAYTSQREVDLHSNVDQTVDSQRNYEYRPSEAPVINLEEVGIIYAVYNLCIMAIVLRVRSSAKQLTYLSFSSYFVHSFPPFFLHPQDLPP